MKWYKHISDSLDDPFIFDLMERYGSDGYLTFFGVLEIYAREFKAEDGWKLTITRRYLKQKLVKRQDTLIIKSLEHIKNSGKWNVEINDDQIVIFIPKFTELLDDWTIRKLRSNSVVTPKILTTDKDTDTDTDKTLNPLALFETFYEAYPKKKSRGQAEKAWLKIKPDEQLLASMIATIERAKTSEEWLKESGKYIPYPASWLNAKGWLDDVEPIGAVVTKPVRLPTKEEELAAFNERWDKQHATG